MKIEIRFLAGARAGQVLEVAEKEVIRLGRHPDNDVVFDPHRDLDVSGHHAELRREADGFYLRDVGSANGTFAGGTRITRLRVASGQELSFGASGPRIAIRFVDGPVTSAAGAAPAGPPRASQPPVAPHAAPQPPAARASGGAPPAFVVPAAPVALAAPSPSAPPPSAPPPAAPPPAAPPAAAPPAPAELSPGQAVAAALGSERKVGARTVAMMIDSALQKSGEKKGAGKSTVFLKSMVSQAVGQSTRRFKVVAILLTALLLGSVGGFLALRHFERREAKEEQSRIQKEMARLMDLQRSGTSTEKTKLAEQIDALSRKLAAASPGGGGKEIVTRNRRRVFLMAFDHPTQGAKGYCTAFAVRKRVLATNAHCVVAYDDFVKQGGLTLYVVMNQDPSKRFRILKVAHHPDYHKPQKTISHDVGLLQIDGDVDELVEIADKPTLQELSAGDLMYTYGFPGRLANPASPDATLVQGVIGRITRLDGQLGGYDDNKLIQHSAFTSGGTSGSPVFNQAGKVIAVNTGGYVEPGSMQVMDPLTGKAGNLMVAKQLAGYNFGIRIDVLQQLVDQVKE